MSADNWTECPICNYKRKNAFKILESKYGKIPQVEYEELKKELEEDFTDIDSEYKGEPVREDYETGLDSKGLLLISYRGECERCGALWEFDKRNILPIDKDDREIVKLIK